MQDTRILIVVDMQNDFIDGSLGTKEAVAILPNVIKKITDYPGEIYYTQDTHYENYLDTFEGKKLPVMHCIKGTQGHRLNKEIKAAAADNQAQPIEKLTFGSVELADMLKKKFKGTLEEIELIGLCTDICIISNALILKAYFPEAKITVDAGCCAGVTIESHMNALAAMKMCHIDIVNED